MAQPADRNPYAAVWEQAERDLVARIQAIHEIGVGIDQARRNLNWRGKAAERFQARAHGAHSDLHMDNDALRQLLRYLRMAAEVKVPHATTAGV